MKSFVINNKEKKEEIYSSKKRQNLLTLDNNIGSNSINKKFKKRILPINGNHRNKNVITIKKRINKNKNQSIELELSNSTKKYLDIINSKIKKDNNKYKNTFQNNYNIDKNKSMANANSFIIYNYAKKRFDKGKPFNGNNKINKTKNNIHISINNSNILALKINNQKSNLKNKDILLTEVNTRKETNGIFRTADINKRIHIIKMNKKDKEEMLNKTNISKNINRIISNKLKKYNNQKQNFNNNFNHSLALDRKPARFSYQKRKIEKVENIIPINNNNYKSKKNNNDEYLRESTKSKNESNLINHFSLSQNNKIRKNRHKQFDYSHLIYKTELNLNNEKTKKKLETEYNSYLNTKESGEPNRLKYNYISPINVHRKIFCFKKNEIIDIKNKNNSIVIIKKKCKNNTNKKKEFFDSSNRKENYNEENMDKFYQDENENTCDINTKSLIMIFDKMKHVNVTIKPRKNLELKLFRHIKRNSVL